MRKIEGGVATFTPRQGRSGGTMTVHGTTALAMCVAILTSVPAYTHSVPVYGLESPETLVQAVPVRLEVENHNWAVVILYVVHDGERTRVPQVVAAHNISVEIP